jgi:hypothetical protein
MGTLPGRPGKPFKEPGGEYRTEAIDGDTSDVHVDPKISKGPELTRAHNLDQRVIIQRIRMKQENCGT